MSFHNLKSLADLHMSFPTEESCILFLEGERWHGNVTSPFDPSSTVWKCKGNKYRCKNTGKYFNVRTNTFLDSSNISLRKWFFAIWLVTSHKKGISSLQLGRDIGVTQKTAWMMAHKIRTNLVSNDESKLSGTVEADESFVGGKNKNRHKDKKVVASQGRSFKDKIPVLGLLERDGRLRAFVIKDTKASSIQPIIFRNVEQKSRFLSDEWWAYRKLDRFFMHNVVDHSKKEYVNKDDSSLHTNTIEGFWGILKRGYNGIYNWWSKKHIQKYVDEFVFRYNTKKLKDSERFYAFFSNFVSKTPYKKLVAL